MEFINSILKLDYSLSDWFSKTNQTIVKGAAFFFLNKVTFLLAALYFSLLPILPFHLDIIAAVGILCGLALLILYGYQSKVESGVNNLNYSKEYAKLSHKEKVIQRLYASLLFIICFIFMFVVAVFCFTGYAKQ
jgi:hypothetical protein